MTTRTLAFTYGSLSVGAGQSDANYTLTGLYDFDEGYSVALLSFRVAVNSATVGGFLSSEAALIAAYTKPDQKLEVVLSSTTRHTYDPSTSVNTGFNQRATCERVPNHRLNTDRSGMYECSVTVDLPADLSGRAGRMSSRINVSEDPSGRRTCTVTGVYTALSNVQARAQFAAQIDAYATTGVIGGLGGVWDLVGDRDAESDDQDKHLRFVRVYREIKHDQSAEGTDLAAVVNPSMIIRRALVATESPVGTAEPPARLQVEYSADVKFSSTTDLDALWRDTIRPYALTEIERIADTPLWAVNEETVRFDPDNNRLEAVLEIVGDPGANFWQLRKDWAESANTGTVLRPVWNGNKWARDRYQGTASHTRSLTYTTVGPTVLGTPGVGKMPRIRHPSAPAISGFIRVRTSRRVRERSVGIAGEETPIYIATTQYFYVRADIVSTVSTQAGNDTTTTGEEGDEPGEGINDPDNPFGSE